MSLRLTSYDWLADPFSEPRKPTILVFGDFLSILLFMATAILTMLGLTAAS